MPKPPCQLPHSQAGALLAVGLGLAGCGEVQGIGAGPSESSGVPSFDAGPVAPDGGIASFEIAPPLFTPCPDGWEERFDEAVGVPLCEPWPRGHPIQWACPVGWRRVVDEGVETCDPYPKGGPESCNQFEVHLPGEPGCVSVGTACPSGEFPEGLPADANVIYVRPGFVGGDGKSPTSPLASLYDVTFERLSQGTVVALAKGTHRWTGVLNRTVTLWGACPAETVLTSPLTLPSDPPLAVISAFPSGLGSNREVTIKNLRVANTPQVGLAVRGRQRLRLEGVVVERASGLGLFASDGSYLSGSGVVVRDTFATPQGQFGWGLSAQRGGRVELRRAVFERNRDSGVVALDPDSRLTLEDACIRNTRSQQANQTNGRGLNLFLDASAVVRRVVIEGNREGGVVADTKAEITLEDVLIRNTLSQQAGQVFGRGLIIQGEAQAQARRILIQGNRELGVYAGDRMSRLILEDAVIEDTRSRDRDQTEGRGLSVEGGGAVELRRAVVRRNLDVGVLVKGEGSYLAMKEVIVRDTKGRISDQAYGRGLSLQDGARVEVHQALFERNREAGVVANTPGTHLILEDTHVRDTLGLAADQRGGQGLSVEGGAKVEAYRAVIWRNREHGILVTGRDSELVAEDTVVGDTQSLGGCSRGGAVRVQEGATAELSRMMLVRNRSYGLLAFAASVMMSDGVIDTVRSATCEGMNQGRFGAVGIASYGEGSAISLDRAQVTGAEQCGLFVHTGAQIDGMQVILTENGVGACLEDATYDLSRLGAEFSNNLERIAFQNLPPPPEPIPSPGLIRD